MTLETPIGNIGPGPTNLSRDLYEEARHYMPRGVQGQGKYYEPYPHYWQKALGARLWDVDGNEYIDYWCAAGPAILGHNHPAVIAAVKQTLDETGVLFSAPYPGELELAKLLKEYVPSAEMSAFACGGSDAVTFAIRAARAVTGKSRILRFEGSYHGWYDGVLFSTSPSYDDVADDERYVAVPDSAGLPPEAAGHVVICAYNDADQFEQLVDQYDGDFAAVIVEPISHTMGVVMPAPGFLERLREVCTAREIPLIFDEIITGFRHGVSGAQSLLNVEPDMTAFGKAMSNGFPISALVGKAEFMTSLTPSGSALFSGTFNGNPMCVSAALATLRVLSLERVHEEMGRLCGLIAKAVNAAAERYDIPAHCASFGSVWSVYFSAEPITNYRQLVRQHSPTANEAFVRHMWSRGIYAKPKQANRWYLNAAHSESDIEKTIAAVEEFFAEHALALRQR